MRARTSALTSSTCGWSDIPASARTVAQRRTPRCPKSIIASRTEPTRCERANSAELAKRSSLWLRPTSRTIVPSTSSNSTLAWRSASWDRPSRPARRDRAAGDDLGLGEEAALEGGEAELAAEGEVGRRVDGGRDQDEVAVAQRGDLGAQAVGAVGGEVELDAPGEVHERLDAGHIGHAVDDDAGAPLDELADRRDELLVGALGGRDLEDDAVGADRHRADPQQQVAADRQPRGVAAGERVQANLGERVDDDLRAVDEQLVAEQVQVAVENRLARDERPRERGPRRWRRRSSACPLQSSVRIQAP